mmetsp:Transcript_17609/g.27556  ORF Transcript_17609/g.27556 Transcript_17609/m.27556 type:complete len:118 (-) Transcript_17609:59-412(-)
MKMVTPPFNFNCFLKVMEGILDYPKTDRNSSSAATIHGDFGDNGCELEKAGPGHHGLITTYIHPGECYGNYQNLTLTAPVEDGWIAQNWYTRNVQCGNENDRDPFYQLFILDKSIIP